MAASVVSGGISLTAPTNVVFPTPNPPAMMILTGCGAVVSGDPVLSGLYSLSGR
ncbi:hypothetical protein [Frankia sp. QA3]|uniref:hypothetical protein n=1 Tax=Frankia sp. QA3 TaxID=710111 RepID=UPI003510B7EC